MLQNRIDFLFILLAEVTIKCTFKGCNVKKQIQRLTKDEEIVVTTHEGMHTHPLQKTTESFEEIFRQIQAYAPL
jgi:hypothetical protein